MMQEKKARRKIMLKVLLAAFGICVLGFWIWSLGFETLAQPQEQVTVLFRFDAEAAGEVLGSSVSTAGDVNGDGRDEVIVGDLFASPGGRAYVLSFTGAPPEGEPDIEVEPGVVNFRAVRVGDSKTKSFTIRNEGEADLEVDGVSGLQPPFFLVSPEFPQTLASGEEIQVKVRFSPTRRGIARKSITIFSNDPTEPEVEVTLKGRTKRER